MPPARLRRPAGDRPMRSTRELRVERPAPHAPCRGPISMRTAPEPLQPGSRTRDPTPQASSAANRHPFRSRPDPRSQISLTRRETIPDPRLSEDVARAEWIGFYLATHIGDVHAKVLLGIAVCSARPG